jgi:hypothetical protein
MEYNLLWAVSHSFFLSIEFDGLLGAVFANVHILILKNRNRNRKSITRKIDQYICTLLGRHNYVHRISLSIASLSCLKPQCSTSLTVSLWVFPFKCTLQLITIHNGLLQKTIGQEGSSSKAFVVWNGSQHASCQCHPWSNQNSSTSLNSTLNDFLPLSLLFCLNNSALNFIGGIQSVVGCLTLLLSLVQHLPPVAHTTLSLHCPDYMLDVLLRCARRVLHRLSTSTSLHDPAEHTLSGFACFFYIFYIVIALVAFEGSPAM